MSYYIIRDNKIILTSIEKPVPGKKIQGDHQFNGDELPVILETDNIVKSNKNIDICDAEYESGKITDKTKKAKHKKNKKIDLIKRLSKSHINRILPQWKHNKINERKLDLLEKRIDGYSLTLDEKGELENINGILNNVKRIREASNKIEKDLEKNKTVKGVDEFKVEDNPNWPFELFGE